MNGNSFGVLFRVTTWGESHGPALGAVIDGCPGGIPLSPADFIPEMRRRQGGHDAHSTPRKEADQVEIESGVFEGRTTGTPIALRIRNDEARPGDYEAYRNVPRPGHADLTTFWKEGVRDHRGGGRASARETAARVAAGVVAGKILHGVDLVGCVSRVGDTAVDLPAISEIRPLAEHHPLRLPVRSAPALEERVTRARELGDSLGGAVTLLISGLPRGLGEPVFDKAGAVLAHALMSLPAATGVEAGGGIPLSLLPGSEARDPIRAVGGEARAGGKIRVDGPRHGGLLGGITTGEILRVTVHFHAPTSIPLEIDSVDLKSGTGVRVKVEGRHDSFPLPRAVPMVEAMAKIALADLWLRAGVPRRG
ncbi:MAG: chorismate synthase [Bdellovibrionales bacterium]|nr:chorismate synthase [Bdellovibrionales bacterium]